MDGSFLSDEQVVAASRNFVCIRLATYEDQQLGIQLGLDWESAIPETDQQSIRAKERARAGR
jgi:hypothetical protein